MCVYKRERRREKEREMERCGKLAGSSWKKVKADDSEEGKVRT